MAARTQRTSTGASADVQRRWKLQRAWRRIVTHAAVLMLIALVIALIVTPDLRTTRGVLGGLGWGAIGVAVACLFALVTRRYERQDV